MNRCPITYEPCGDLKYSRKGLVFFSKKLRELHDFPYTAEEQVVLAAKFTTKMAIQRNSAEAECYLEFGRGKARDCGKRRSIYIKTASSSIRRASAK